MSNDHTMIQCLSVPGTGYNHLIQVTVDGVASLVRTDVFVSYGPPSILDYSGAGSLHAQTRGYEVQPTEMVLPLYRRCVVSWMPLCVCPDYHYHWAELRAH